jgi:Putative adhesin
VSLAGSLRAVLARLVVPAVLVVLAAPAAADRPPGAQGSQGSASPSAPPSSPSTSAGSSAAARGPADQVSERARLSIEPAGPAIKRLSIENPLGDVRVEGYDGTALQIDTHKFAPDEDSLDRLHISLVPNPDGTVTIKTTADSAKEARPVARSAVRVDLVIRAPRDARVEAAVSSGKLEVINMDAGGDLDTGSGPISVRNVQGELWTHSVSGMTRLTQVFGSVDAQSLTSDVDLDTIGGARLVASVHRGRIDGRRVRARDIELTTTDGSIVLEAEAALRGHLVVSSFRGDIDVQLRRHGGVVVRARGSKVDLGVPVRARPNGWFEAAIAATGPAALVGAALAEAALVELRAAHGNVKFSVIDSRPSSP